jgi:hypothetical protein
MGRKPIKEEDVKKIIKLRSKGKTISEIEEETGFAHGTIMNYITRYKDWIEEMKNNQRNMDLTYSDEKKKKDKNKRGQSYFVSIEDETAKKAIRKAADTVGTLKAKEITEDYKAAQILHSASVWYQKNVEMMGLEWDKFVAWCIDEGYERVVEAYEEKVRKRLRETELLQDVIKEEPMNPEQKQED